MTRKERKGYLLSDPGCEALADAFYARQLIDTAEWTERIAICNNAFCKSGPDASQSFDLGGVCDVDIDDRGRWWWLNCLGAIDNMRCGLRFLWPLPFLYLLADRIDGFDLRIECAPS